MRLAKDHAGDTMPSIILPDLDMTLIRAIEFIGGYCNKHKICTNCKQEFEQKCFVPCTDYEMGYYDGLAKARDTIMNVMEGGEDE